MQACKVGVRIGLLFMDWNGAEVWMLGDHMMEGCKYDLVKRSL